MELPQINDEISLVFKPKTFRAHQMGRVVQVSKKEVTVRSLTNTCEETIALKLIKTISILEPEIN